MEDPKLQNNVPNGAGENTESKDTIHLEETFYILSKKNSVFRVQLTSKGLSLRKESDGNVKEQTILMRDIIGSKCMRSKRRHPGAGSCVCSSLIGQPQLKVVEETSGDLDENDISAYLYIYAYILKRTRRNTKRERTTITLRFRSFDKYEDNNREAQKWRCTIKCLIAGVPIAHTPPLNEKKLLVLLNPKSGPGKAREQFQSKVAPILQEAEVPFDLHVTKYAQYAREFVRTRNIYSWRGIVAVGGDGLLFEVLNGLFERLDWQQALMEVPLALVPCGSGNGLVRSVFHLYNEPYIAENLTGISMALARGKTAPMDVVRVETKTKIMFSFVAVGWGLLSDIDIESERLRAIGGQRFTIWALARILSLRRYKGTISYVKIKDVNNLPKPKLPLMISHSISQDTALDSPDAEAFADCDTQSAVFTTGGNGKHQRVDSWYSVNSRKSAYFSTRGSEYHSVTSANSEMRSPVHACMHGPASRLPSLMSQVPTHWVHEEGEFITVHVGYQSHIAEEFLFAPRSQLSDGVMWMLIIKAGISRSELFQLFLGISEGLHTEVTNEYVKLIPVSAFRLVPEEGGNGILTVDGEVVEYGPIQAEVFPNIVNLLVPDTK